MVAGIHPDAMKELYDQATELPVNKGFQLCLEIPESEAQQQAPIRNALQTQLSWNIHKCEREIREKIRQGIKTLFLGMLAVAALVLFAEWLKEIGSGRLHRIFGESLVIIAWVTLWGPAETLICDPLPLRRKIKIFQAILRAPVIFSLRSAASKPTPPGTPSV